MEAPAGPEAKHLVAGEGGLEDGPISWAFSSTGREKLSNFNHLTAKLQGAQP